jgi:hypothetical protein
LCGLAKAFSYIASQKSIFPNLTEFKDIGFHAVGSSTSALFEAAPEDKFESHVRCARRD